MRNFYNETQQRNAIKPICIIANALSKTWPYIINDKAKAIIASHHFLALLDAIDMEIDDNPRDIDAYDIGECGYTKASLLAAVEIYQTLAESADEWDKSPASRMISRMLKVISSCPDHDGALDESDMHGKLKQISRYRANGAWPL